MQSDEARPAFPLAQTQAGVLEHTQIYFAGVAVNQHAHYKNIVRELRGSRSLSLVDFLTHIVVGSQMTSDEKIAVATHTATRGMICKVVACEWLDACHQVRPIQDP